MPNTTSGNTNNAQQVIVNVTANTTGVVQGAQQAQQALQNISNTQVSSNSTATLRQQLRQATVEAQRLLQAGQQNTAAYRQAVQTIADLKDQQELLNRTVSAFDPGNRFNAFIGIARSGATAIQGYAGAMTVLGANSESAQQAIAKLQGIMAFTDAINAVGDLWDFWKGYLLSLQGGTTIAQANATATQAQTVAQTAQTAATTGSTVATKALGVALKSIGIGLLIAAIAYLVSNWDNLKASVTKLIPSLNGAGDTFNKVKNIVVGVGNAVVQYLIAPIKAVIDLVQGDFKKALSDLKQGADVVNNFKDGQRQGELNDAEKQRKELLKIQVKQYDDTIERLKAAGKDTYALEQDNRIRKLLLEKQGSDESKKLEQEIAVERIKNDKKNQDEKDKKAKEANDKAAAAAKQAAEKAKADRKANLDEVKKDNDEADKDLRQQNLNAKDKELDDLKSGYDAKIKVYQKYGSDTSKLTEAYNVDKASINKKYDDIINQAIVEAENKNLDTYEQKKLDINKKIDDLLKNATDDQKKQLEQLKASQLNDVNQDKKLNTVSVKAQVNLTTVTSENTVSDADTPEVKYNKTLKLLSAQREAENAAFALELEQKKGNDLELEKAEADHKAKLKGLDDGELKAKKDKADAEKELDKASLDSKLTQLNTVGTALGSFSQLAGEQTVAGKALAVAQATISAITGAVQSFTAMSSIPIVGPALGAVAAAGALAAGYANVKKIIAVKVPGQSSGGSISAPSLASAVAPVISANDLNQSTGTQDVRVVNQQDQVVKAYITDRDLKDNEDKTNFMNKLSTI